MNKNRSMCVNQIKKSTMVLMSRPGHGNIDCHYNFSYNFFFQKKQKENISVYNDPPYKFLRYLIGYVRCVTQVYILLVDFLQLKK